MGTKKSTHKLGRRQFLAGTAAAATISIIKPSAVRGTEANSTIALALLGCGGRGTWIAPFFERHGGYRFVACADYYQEQVDKFGEKHKIEPGRRYTTLSGYKKLLEEKFDAVVIETPPYFHPEHAAAAVEAGKHVYLAKPIAVDVPGCLSIAESGKKATGKKLVYLVDFQTRANEFYREAAKRVHNGDIGKLICGESRYPWAGGDAEPPATPEDRLRRWYCIKAISGDFIVEQNIHTLDVATWFINADPIKALGTCYRKGLRRYGDISDHFSIDFWFPNDFLLSFNSVQVIPGAPNEIPCRIYGTRGTVDTDYYSHVWIHGKKEYPGGTFDKLYDTGTAVNVKEFHEFLTKGNYANETVAPSVRSNLTCVLGRTAAYTGKEVTWAELIKANEKLETDLSGLKS